MFSDEKRNILTKNGTSASIILENAKKVKSVLENMCRNICLKKETVTTKNNAICHTVSIRRGYSFDLEGGSPNIFLYCL